MFPTDEFPDLETLNYGLFRSPEVSGFTLICSGSGAFSSMIQKATGSVWSHIGILHWDTESERLGVIESVEGHGFRFVALSHYLSDYNGTGEAYPGGLAVIRHKDMTPEKANDGYKWAWPRLGRAYDKGEIASIAWRIVSGSSGKRDGDGTYICSEAGGLYHAAAGCPVQWNEKGFLAPSDYALDPAFEMFGVLKPKP